MLTTTGNGDPKDLQCPGHISLEPLSPSLTPVATTQGRPDPLPIRPFPLLEFLQSDELAVLQAMLEESDEGKNINHFFGLQTQIFPLQPTALSSRTDPAAQ